MKTLTPAQMEVAADAIEHCLDSGFFKGEDTDIAQRALRKLDRNTVIKRAAQAVKEQSDEDS